MARTRSRDSGRSFLQELELAMLFIPDRDSMPAAQGAARSGAASVTAQTGAVWRVFS
ncbi:MAG: hypothetical protein KDJ76_07175 [Xanthobacteraceae bacterium]|nr:hypothetical protein [Xanthobacteraceae bacterium]